VKRCISKPLDKIIPSSKISMSPKITKRKGKYIKPRIIEPDLQIDHRHIMGITPISEAVGESSNTYGNLKYHEIRDSAETRIMSQRFDDIVKIKENELELNKQVDKQTLGIKFYLIIYYFSDFLVFIK
jgi:hypothetical protein